MKAPIPPSHPHFGCAITITRTMSSTDSPGATPHTEGHPWAEEDVEASRQILRRRLAKKQDHLEERAETISAQRLRIRELEEEVERMRDAMISALSELRMGAKTGVQGDTIQTAEEIIADALDGAEGSTNG